MPDLYEFVIGLGCTQLMSLQSIYEIFPELLFRCRCLKPPDLCKPHYERF